MKKGGRDILHQFLRFAGVGAIGTLTHYATLIGLVQVTGVAPVFASPAGFVLGAVVNYLLNYRYTFHSNRRHREAVIRFFTVALMGLLLNTLTMTVATVMFTLHYLLAQVIATGLVLLWNFTGNRLWTFRERAHAPRH